VGGRSRGRFATPADFPLHDGTSYRGLHLRRWGLGFFHRSRTILCRAVPNPNVTIRNFLHRCITSQLTEPTTAPSRMKTGRSVGPAPHAHGARAGTRKRMSDVNMMVVPSPTGSGRNRFQPCVACVPEISTERLICTPRQEMPNNFRGSFAENGCAHTCCCAARGLRRASVSSRGSEQGHLLMVAPAPPHRGPTQSAHDKERPNGLVR
jgi:hypothetical protein